MKTLLLLLTLATAAAAKGTGPQEFWGCWRQINGDGMLVILAHDAPAYDLKLGQRGKIDVNDSGRAQLQIGESSILIQRQGDELLVENNASGRPHWLGFLRYERVPESVALSTARWHARGEMLERSKQFKLRLEVEQQMLDNLMELAATAHSYFEEKAQSQVTFQQLVSYLPFILKQKTADGEDYNGLVFHRAGCRVTLVSNAGVMAAFDYRP